MTGTTPTSSLSQPPSRDAYTVSRLNRDAKALLESNFPLIWVEGEISNLARPASGHLYFSLKDNQAQVRCAMFRGSQRQRAVAPRDGMHVLLRARVSLYEGRGEFQLIVEHLEEAGEGALRLAFEQLKNRLAQEGLFDAAHKKALPRLPRRIGVITSPTGAAVRDILTTLGRRFPAIGVRVYPVAVQGADAAGQIAAAIQRAGRDGDCDALILARGGGSLEDLWAFNEEVVARAVYACPVPLVAGIGHETDFSIADLVADARAPTPTAAAEMLSPDAREWLAEFDYYAARLERLMRGRLADAQQATDWLAGRLVHPRERLRLLSKRLAELAHRQRLAMRHHHQNLTARLATARARLHQHSPIARLRESRLRLDHHNRRLRTSMQNVLTQHRQQLAVLGRQLHALSPLATLGRGYAIVQHAQTGAVIQRAGDLKTGDRVRTRLAAGLFTAVIEGIET